VQLAGHLVETDLSPASWLAGALDAQASGTVASLVPPVFEACARVLHPAVRYAGDDDVEVRWAEVAAHNDRAMHRLVQWPSITGDWDYVLEDAQPPTWHRAPDEGHLPAALARRLTDVLGRHTAAPDDCWVGLWDGHGFAAAGDGVPRLPAPGRAFLLLRGDLRLAAANLAPEPWEQSANLWWPADRGWCVATDVDLMSTYVGGSARLVADLLAAPGLEAWPAEAGDPVGYAADTVNPPPDGGR
jgi:hypothetical protein